MNKTKNDCSEGRCARFANWLWRKLLDQLDGHEGPLLDNIKAAASKHEETKT